MSTSIKDIVGTWQLCESQDFEKYMEAIGVNEAMLAVASKNLSVDAKLTHVISECGGLWSIITQTPSGQREVKFGIGEEISTVTLDGRAVKQKTTISDNKMVEEVKGDGFTSRAERFLKSADVMVTVFTGNGATSTRTYKRIIA